MPRFFLPPSMTSLAQPVPSHASARDAVQACLREVDVALRVATAILAQEGGGGEQEEVKNKVAELRGRLLGALRHLSGWSNEEGGRGRDEEDEDGQDENETPTRPRRAARESREFCKARLPREDDGGGEADDPRRHAKRMADNPHLNPALALGLRNLLSALGKKPEEVTRDEMRKYGVWVVGARSGPRKEALQEFFMRRKEDLTAPLSTSELAAEADLLVEACLGDADVQLYWDEKTELPAVVGGAHGLYDHDHFRRLSSALARQVVPEDSYLRHCGCVVELHRAAEGAKKHPKCVICGVPVRSVQVGGVGNCSRVSHLSCAVFVTCSVRLMCTT